ncbi:MAG: GNAT family N-acetyltransferase, partial [Rubrobacteraceae bacterium]
PKFEIGYWRRSRFAGQGYITEAVRGIAAFAFDTEIRCDLRNHRSVKVAERASFTLEGELRNDTLAPDGTPRNTLVFSTISEDELS